MNRFQFTNASATELRRRNGYGLIFFLSAIYPVALSMSYYIFAQLNGLDFFFVMQLVVRFSPLTTMDLYRDGQKKRAVVAVCSDSFQARKFMQFSTQTFRPSLFSLWSYAASYVIVHWPIYRIYMGKGQRLTDFAKTYSSTMIGVVTKGNFLY